LSRASAYPAVFGFAKGLMAIRILLTDDHELVRKGIKALFGGVSDWEVCGEAANGKEAVEKAIELKPDLILMDISMPVMNGIEATRLIRRAQPLVRIVMLTMHDSPQIAEQARNAGANACLVKTGSLEDLRHTIAAVLKEA
jgi:two-component system, NarL family, nitrate/nitrite response regulator NarL